MEKYDKLILTAMIVVGTLAVVTGMLSTLV